jgi:hypothetical protein
VAATAPITALRVAAWTWKMARRTKARLSVEGLDALGAMAPPPQAAVRQRATVSAVLRLVGATCLVRSAVLQRWDADHDRPRELIIGVARDGQGSIAAHAWLEGEASRGRYVELHRRPPGR